MHFYSPFAVTSLDYLFFAHLASCCHLAFACSIVFMSYLCPNLKHFTLRMSCHRSLFFVFASFCTRTRLHGWFMRSLIRERERRKRKQEVKNECGRGCNGDRIVHRKAQKRESIRKGSKREVHGSYTLGGIIGCSWTRKEGMFDGPTP
jgi:hypothetical protein